MSSVMASRRRRASARFSSRPSISASARPTAASFSRMPASAELMPASKSAMFFSISRSRARRLASSPSFSASSSRRPSMPLAQGFGAELRPGPSCPATPTTRVGEELALVLLALDLDRQAEDRLLVLDELGLHAVDDVEVLLEGEVDRVYLGLDLVALLGLAGDVLVAPVLLLDELPEAQEVEVELGREDLLAEAAVLQRLLGLGLEGIVAALDLGEDAADLAHVLLGLLELELGLAGAHLVLGDARGLLEEVAAVLGLGGEDLVDLALLHHGVGRLADARVPEELAQLLEPDLGAVDVVLGLAGTVEAALNGDLGSVDRREEAGLIGDGDRDFGDGERLARLGAVEDHVFHAVGAQGLRADCSPTTHFIASTTLDLPQPLGPRRAEMPSENSIKVRSAKDLKPNISRLFRNTNLSSLSPD